MFEQFLMPTFKSIQKILKPCICDCKETYNSFKQRLEQGELTRDENSETHFCVYFLPYNSRNKKVFLVHHKKSNLWLSPGGHIDKGETLIQTLNREIQEELGVKNAFKQASPFFLTLTPIKNKIQPCKAHYDIWYLFYANGNNFNIDHAEFHDTMWLTIAQAKKIVADPNNLKALEVVKGE